MFAINAFGLPIVFGLANLIDLFGRNWEIYKTRATDKKAKKICNDELFSRLSHELCWAISVTSVW